MKTLLIVLAFILIGICVGRKPIKCEVCGADDASSDGVTLKAKNNQKRVALCSPFSYHSYIETRYEREHYDYTIY